MRRNVLSCIAMLALCGACSKAAVKKDAPPNVEPPEPVREQVDVDILGPMPEIDKVLDAARRHLGKTTVRVNGKSFRYDCSGFVRGMFSAAGIDVMSEPGESEDNGVRLIFRYVDHHGQNHFRKLPQKGDIVYFDNTWDKNGNGKLDDPLTHVGIVEAVKQDGTMTILHRANRGIVRDPMNLMKPHDLKDEDGRDINAWLRPKGRRDPSGTPHLMSELFAGFGTVAKEERVSER